jgi:DeoR/GlpR family transcriptional regulator of sugar metabolism
MENAGLLKRFHGGAAIQDHKNREVPFEIRNRENTETKRSDATLQAVCCWKIHTLW